MMVLTLLCAACAGAPSPVRVVDLAHPLASGIPAFDGPAEFSTALEADYDQGYFLRRFAATEHTGTHVDAPAHFARGRPTIDAIPAAALRAPAVVVDVRAQVARDPDYRVTAADLQRAAIPDGALVIAYTGWSERWPDVARYRSADAHGVMHFPGFSAEAVEWLLENHPSFVGLGIDTLSTDHGPSTDFPVHRKLHGAGRYGVENLANLAALPAAGATIVVAPLAIAGGSGAPARVLAEVPATE